MNLRGGFNAAGTPLQRIPRFLPGLLGVLILSFDIIYKAQLLRIGIGFYRR
jgi:hypothetical protein